MANKCLICAIVCCCIVIFIILLAFLGVFVGIPMAYKNSIDMQRSHIFPTEELLPEIPNFLDPEGVYQIHGVRNLHVKVSAEVQLGVWHLVPSGLLQNETHLPRDFSFSASLFQSGYPVLVHFHSYQHNRIGPKELYAKLRFYFHIIAFDYRSYGDSTKATLEEEGLVEDSVGLYKWLRAQTSVPIYFWGHDIGAAISTHTIAKLRDQNIMPMGLFLEAPITSIEEFLDQTNFNKAFRWLAWYKSTLLDPLAKNGFVFNTTKHIAAVECPIMIIHAEDDDITPSYFSEQLSKAAQANRSQYQGNVTLHLIAGFEGCHHFQIHSISYFLTYIQQHLDICQRYSKGKN